ncbi:hypothetical protein APR04_005886 [Promicromonospora umidemergens]|uniref:Uncharacterized protein n=1 Tax=Promicromonospora umidemergens TaxID=629679 RepID=A0ABP8WLN3_9MICO|nr:hypothetical protein [Promicromonospora umidemergens]MCP2286939.1 hypothetical protein [Promicromonospora umidemergens]
MISNSFGSEAVRALFQAAKEFNVIPDEDLDSIGTTRPVVEEWTTNLRSLRAAMRTGSPDEGAGVEVVDGNLVLRLPSVADDEEPATIFVLDDAQYFRPVSDHLVALMGDREIFLRTGFDADEIRDVALKISRLTE